MNRLFAVIRSRGPGWNAGLPLEKQAEWTAHAEFMDGLVFEKFVLLGGPLEGSSDVLLIIRARDESQIEERLGSDPWMRNGLLVPKRIWPWQLRLGALA